MINQQWPIADTAPAMAHFAYAAIPSERDARKFDEIVGLTIDKNIFPPKSYYQKHYAMDV